MRKINTVGEKLIEYHGELNKGYPKIVQDSLFTTLQQMMENDVIDLGTYELLKNDKVNKENLIKALKENKRYVKSREELLKEYEIIRKELDEDLEMNHLSHITTESKIDTDEIYVCKTFTVDRAFVTSYFGVEDRDISKLMSRKGFVEKFVALRLVKVLRDIIMEGENRVSKVTLGNSLAYIDESGDQYNIDLVMKVKIEDLEEIQDKGAVMQDIKEIESISERVYKQKMKD